jgi:hypothetical protein
LKGGLFLFLVWFDFVKKTGEYEKVSSLNLLKYLEENNFQEIDSLI